MWLLGLPHIMVVGFQEGTVQVAKAEAADLVGHSLRVTLLHNSYTVSHSTSQTGHCGASLDLRGKKINRIFAWEEQQRICSPL